MPNSVNDSLSKSLRDIKLGDHLCLIYETQEEQFEVVIPFIKYGLEKNEKCIYVADDNTVEQVMGAMSSVDSELFTEAIKKGSLLILTKKDSYLKDGYFDPEKMIALLKQIEQEAIRDGYSGLRVTGEMTWMLAAEPGSDRLMEYEAELNNFIPGSKACGICQYNAKRFSNEILLDVFSTHPFVIIRGRLVANPLYSTPEEFLLRRKSLR